MWNPTSEALLEREILDSQEIDLIMNDEKLPPVKYTNKGNGSAKKDVNDTVDAKTEEKNAQDITGDQEAGPAEK